MPAWGAIAKVFWSRYGRTAVLWLLKQIGLETVLKKIEAKLNELGDRRRAIRKARHTRDGRWAPVIVEGRTRYVVYTGDDPVEIMPAMSGDLAGAMRSFDTSSLRSPNDVASARFKAWATQRWNKLEEDVSDEAEPLTPPPLDTEQTVREALDKTEEGGGRALFDAMVATLPGLLEQLTQVDGKPVADHDSVPEAPGVYFFSEGVNPIYVGQSRHLRRRLRQHTSPSSRENQAALAWQIALTSRPRRTATQSRERGRISKGTRHSPSISEMRSDALLAWTCDSSRSPIPSREPSSRSTPRELWAPMSSTPGRRTDRAGALLQRRSRPRLL